MRSASGVLATVEAGNTFTGPGGEGDWKLSGRDGLLVMQNGAVRWITAAGAQQLAAPPPEQLSVVALRNALARWQAGAPPATGIEDCWRAMRLIDRAYAMAG
jgi:hypothetical protein